MFELYTYKGMCLKKLKSVAPDLNLGTRSLTAWGLTTASNTGKVNERCLMRHGRWRTETYKNMYVFVCFCCLTSHVNSYGHCGTVSSLKEHVC